MSYEMLESPVELAGTELMRLRLVSSGDQIRVRQTASSMPTSMFRMFK